MTPFVILALPRSRTAWLSRFLTYDQWTCAHEEIRHCRSMDDVRSWMSLDYVGSVETSVAPWWRLLQPGVLDPLIDLRIVTVRRPVEQVIASLSRHDLFKGVDLVTTMRRLDRKLDQLERRLPGVLRVTFDELETAVGCARVFERCLCQPMDHAWWQELRGVDVQKGLVEQHRYFQAYRPQLDKLAKLATHELLQTMRQNVVVPDIDGLVIKQESFEAFYRDGRELFDEHLTKVGEEPGAAANKNIPLMRILDGLGCMQVTTARINGRMFGYLMSVISPSLERKDEEIAMQATFYASPDVRGLGMKLQREALRALWQRGVTEVHMRAGVRGDGPRMGALYRRLGAEAAGETYVIRRGI